MDLISRDAAIAAIEAAKRDFPEAEFVTKDFSICESVCIGLSRAALEVSAVPSQWVSVKDVLPEKGSICLVCGKNGGMRVARASYYGPLDLWTVVGTGKPFRVAYWMDLPAPPSAD